MERDQFRIVDQNKIMKITNGLEEKSIYLQGRDVKYLKDNYKMQFPQESACQNDDAFILINDEKLVKAIKEKGEILELKTFLEMSRKEAFRFLEDSEQEYEINRRRKIKEETLKKYKYIYGSAIIAYSEKMNGTLSFPLPLSIDMLKDYLLFSSDGTYYASSTTVPDTFMIGRNDDKMLDYYDRKLVSFAKEKESDMINYVNNHDESLEAEKVEIKKLRTNDYKRLYYTIRKK